MKQTRSLWGGLKRHSLILVTTLILVFLYLYRLSRLPVGGGAVAEQGSLAASSTLHAVLAQPFFLPLDAARYLALTLLPSHQLLAIRLPSVAVAIVVIAALLYITRRWYGHRTLLFAIVLLASSAWFLHIGRLGTNDIAYLAAIPLLCLANLLLYEYTDKKLVLALWVLVMVLALYIPGLVWLVLASVLFERRELSEAFGGYGWLRRLGLFVLAALLFGPFVYGTVHNLDIPFGLHWLGLPSTLPNWQQPFKDAAAALLFIGVRTPADPSRWLGQLPLLDAFLSLGFLAGVIFYIQHLHAERTRLLLVFGGIGLLLCAGGGPVSRSVLVPIIYLITFGGIAFLLHQWLKLFPRNPLARRLGIGLVSIAVGVSCLYGLRHYFVAWPHNPDTIAAFNATDGKGAN